MIVNRIDQLLECLNPSIQIRTVPTLPRLKHQKPQHDSQPLNTDQGSSDVLKARKAVREEDLESQSLNTDQGSSDSGARHPCLPSKHRVSIPQYRSGQFRPYRLHEGYPPSSADLPSQSLN